MKKYNVAKKSKLSLGKKTIIPLDRIRAGQNYAANNTGSNASNGGGVCTHWPPAGDVCEQWPTKV